MVRVGVQGEVGTVEIQDLLFTVQGATAGAVLVEWNISPSAKGAAAMWGKLFSFQQYIVLTISQTAISELVEQSAPIFRSPIARNLQAVSIPNVSLHHCYCISQVLARHT